MQMNHLDFVSILIAEFKSWDSVHKNSHLEFLQIPKDVTTSFAQLAVTWWKETYLGLHKSIAWATSWESLINFYGTELESLYLPEFISINVEMPVTLNI